jgi:hypothetical protein
MFIVFPPLVKACVALIISVRYAGLTLSDDLADKRTFSPFTTGEEKFSRDTTVQIKPKVNLGLI